MRGGVCVCFWIGFFSWSVLIFVWDFMKQGCHTGIFWFWMVAFLFLRSGHCGGDCDGYFDAEGAFGWIVWVEL